MLVKYKVDEQKFSLFVLLMVTTGIVFDSPGDLWPLAKFFGIHPSDMMCLGGREQWARLILVQHPDLAKVDSTKLDSRNHKLWLELQEAKFGKTLSIRFASSSI